MGNGKKAVTPIAHHSLLITQVRMNSGAMRRAVFAQELPPAFHGARREIIVRIIGRVARRAIADFQIHGVARRTIDEMMAVGLARRKSRAHATLSLLDLTPRARGRAARPSAR